MYFTYYSWVQITRGSMRSSGSTKADVNGGDVFLCRIG